MKLKGFPQRFAQQPDMHLIHTVLSPTFLPAPKPSGRRARKPGIDRKPRQAYSAKQLERLENEFKVRKVV